MHCGKNRVAPVIVRAGILLLFMAGACGAVSPVPALRAVVDKPSELAIESAPGTVILKVELANSYSARRQGLKDRRRLAPDAGMLFVFEEPVVTSMWMVDTYIPLDMIFIDADGFITRIARNTEPLSETLISSGSPVKAVLEVNSGTAREFGIKPGDRVIHPAIIE